MKLSGLHILLTYQCTCECDHCFVWGSPWQTGALTLAQIEQILAQAKEAGVESIYLEGGEPFLYYAILVQAVPDCYFCSQPMPNEWIEVKTPDGSRVEYAGDEPVTVAGTLKVGAIYKGRYMESLYRLELDQLVK